MNCKQKAMLVGIGWGVGLLLALAAVIGMLTALMYLAEVHGVGHVLLGLLGTGSAMVLFTLIAKAGHDDYLEKHCKEVE